MAPIELLNKVFFLQDQETSATEYEKINRIAVLKSNAAAES